jgi:Amt family ammonium transporter
MENFSDVKYILDGFLLVMSGALVMWMAAGFAMLEAGLTRTKNNSVILTKNIGLFALASVMYYFLGYNLMYGEGNSFIGGGAMLSGMSNGDHSLMADFFFQVVFVATAASVISGVVAERMRMWSFFVFVIVLTAFIYPIQGHWTWGGGLTGEGGLIEGFSDFAGSTIVHSVGGWAALAGVLLLGARKGKLYKRRRRTPDSRLQHAAGDTGYFYPLVRMVRFQRRQPACPG